MAGISTVRRVARIALVFGAPLFASCQKPSAPPPFAAYQSVPQAIADQDAALLAARAQMLTAVSSKRMPDMLQAANHGDGSAMQSLGCVYWDGLLNHSADTQRGLQWFQQAAVAGNLEAISMIGDHYVTGAGGKPDYDLAKLWYGKGYTAKDARSTVGLAQMSCMGNGVKQDIVQCGKLADDASSFMKDGDALDVKPMVAEIMFQLAGDYRSGIGTARDVTQAAAWYAKSADLARPSAAVALSRLYVEPGGLPTDLVHAAAVLDDYVKKFGPYPTLSPEDGQNCSEAYGEIGAAYEKSVPAKMDMASTMYRHAADLGYPDALIALALRYVQGTDLPQNLPLARSLLTGWSLCRREDGAVQGRYLAALDAFNGQVKLKGVSTPIPYVMCPAAAAMSAAMAVVPPAPVMPRFPNVLAPNTVTPQQKFPVMVSLNTAKLDAGTTVVSAANQQDGAVMVSMPAGMTSILISVSLVAPQMTSVDGNSTQNIELTLNQDSSTAVFQMQAGTDPGVESMFATMTYNGAFLASLRRDVTVAAPGKLATNTAPAAAEAGAVAPAVASPAAAAASQPLTLRAAAPPIVGLEAPKMAVQHPPAIQLEPEARAPDITIQEIQAGGSLLYTVTSPLLPGFEKSVVAVAATRQAIVQKLYTDLEAQGNKLDQIGGKDASQQAKDFAEGQGAALYDDQAPQAFKTVYQKLKKMGAPPLTIEVLTDEPSLPWELMRPMTDDGKREDFLGITLSVVHSTASSAPRVPPPPAEALDKISVVMPQYSGDLALAGAQKELQAMKASFPKLDLVTGTVTAVSSLARDVPDGIVHYAGHGVRVTTKGLPPDVGILLADGSLVPDTWLSLAEHGTGHPFYFFNACDLGQSDSVLNYVDGWAPKLLQSGASGYLGALWKVSDKTAGSFSAHFYADLKAKLSAGTPWSVADLVTQARRETYAEAYDPTALAYVLYSAPYQTLGGGDATDGGN